ncbi:MAG: NfeD family protein [Actinomycetota bacterium]|nr:NfeD family protein [Actinomycetota bacterium]
MGLLIGGTLAYLFLGDPWRWVVIGGLALFEAFEIMLWLWLRGRPPSTGPEALVGRMGLLTATGRVRLGGTSYAARVLDGAPGDRVSVEAVEGLTLVVRRVPPERSEPRRSRG